MVAVARSCCRTSLTRYGRSRGLWLLLLVAPVAARFWIRPSDSGIAVIAVDGRMPILTSAMLGVSLGIVVSTILLPVAFIYLRANATRIQPWQIEEVAAGSRVGVALGRFAADVAVLGAVLCALTVAGWTIAAIVRPVDGIRPGEIALALWLVAAPALTGVAALRILFDALPATRGAYGEVLFFVLWFASFPIAMEGARGGEAGLAMRMSDFAGFYGPLTAGFAQPPGMSIGASASSGGTIAIDVMRGLASDGYAASRAIWAGIAVAVAALAGLVYRPHRGRVVRAKPKQWTAWLRPARSAAMRDAPAAGRTARPFARLVIAEAALIGRGRLWRMLAAAVALSGLVAPYRTVVGPGGLLLLVLGLVAQAGRSEPGRLLALTGTMTMSPTMRRIAFVAAGTGLSVAMGAGAILTGALGGDLMPLWLAVGTGAGASTAAVLLAGATRSAFAPRALLLVAWYGYLASA